MIGCVSINAVHTTGPGTFKHIRSQLSGVEVDLMLDLGAKVSILISVDYNTLLSTLPLHSSNITLSTYSGAPIPCLGRFDDRVVDQPQSYNVAAIFNISEPVDARQLLRFVCTASHYMKFIPGFADLCEPLRKLLKADAIWNW